MVRAVVTEGQPRGSGARGASVILEDDDVGAGDNLGCRERRGAGRGWLVCRLERTLLITAAYDREGSGEDVREIPDGRARKAPAAEAMGHENPS